MLPVSASFNRSTRQSLPYVRLGNSELSCNLRWLQSCFECGANRVDFSNAQGNGTFASRSGTVSGLPLMCIFILWRIPAAALLLYRYRG